MGESSSSHMKVHNIGKGHALRLVAISTRKNEGQASACFEYDIAEFEALLLMTEVAEVGLLL